MYRELKERAAFEPPTYTPASRDRHPHLFIGKTGSR
jgi:hypothetical protein